MKSLYGVFGGCLLAALGCEAAAPAFMTRDDGVKVTCVPEWKPRMLEITRKFERTRFGLMPAIPADLKSECLSEDRTAYGGRATVKRIKFTWGRLYDTGCFHATAVLPNRAGVAAAFLYVRETPVPERPEPSDDWPVDEIVRRGYATVAFDGSELTPAVAVDAVTQRAWALRVLYEWARQETCIDEMTVGPVGCGPLDGAAALWAGSYDWRFYLCIAAQCGLDRAYVELAANNTPGLLYTCSAGDQPPEEVACDRALAEDVSPAWTIYNGLKGFRGNTDWHLRPGRRGLVREDWSRFMDFTDRHGWALGDQQKPTDDVPPLLTTYDGRKTVSTREEWEAVRRPEIVRFFAEKVYGVAPAKPADLCFERTAPDREMTLANGVRVVRKLLKATWTAPLGKGEFPFQAYVPKRGCKVPAVLFLSLSKKRMDPDRKEPNHNWDVEQICARGYAAVGVYYGDISPDRAHDFDVPPFNLYAKPADRKPSDWCAIAAWAWGMSRVMDWIETEESIDARKVIAGGHSRGGKTALWAGVSDTRFAMAVPFGSGRTGMMLNHIRTPFPTETIGLINQQPHWFTPWYKSLTNREFETTFDHHQLAACLAPRLLFVCEGTGDMSRHGDWYSLVLASPAWELYGKKGLKTEPMPGVAQPAWADGQGFCLRFGPHSVEEEDWKAVLDFADARMR